MEYSMYVCPSCKKVFKVKGNDKNVNCTKCEGMPLLDMHIDEQLWKSYDAMTKDKKISQELEGVVIEEYEEESEVDSNTIDTNPIINTAPSNTTQGKSSVIQPKPKKSLICEMCGSTDLMKQEGVFVCQSCGTKYSVEEAKKMMIEGTVDVSGSTVKVDSSDELKNLYELARRARNDNNSENALKYYEQIIFKDPSSWEANFYNTYYQAMGCKIGEIGVASLRVSGCLETVFNLIKDNVIDPDERRKTVDEVAAHLISISNMLFNGYYSHHNNMPFTLSIQPKYLEEYLINCGAARDIAYKAGNIIEELFGGEYKDIITSCWKMGVQLSFKMLSTDETISEYSEKIRKYDFFYEAPKKETNSESQSGSSSGSCYVATAIYGSYDCPQVWTLRRYRDYTLAKTWYGRSFVRIYYATSPTLVKWFGHTSWFKKMWRGKLDRMVNRLQDKGYDSAPYEDQHW